MRNLLLVALVVVVAGCGAYRFPGGSAAGTGTVTGQVVAVPCAPVENPQSICKGRPAADVEIVFTTANGAVASTKTDSGGNYSIQLDAGTWKVTLKSYMRIIGGPVAVTVTADSAVVANYVVDSGIRVPQPAG